MLRSHDGLPTSQEEWESQQPGYSAPSSWMALDSPNSQDPPFPTSAQKKQSPFIAKLCTPPLYFPPVEVPSHLLKRSKGLGKRERLLLWWLTYRLPVEREIDDTSLQSATSATGLCARQIREIEQTNPIHWERMLWKRKIRRNFFNKEGWVPAGQTPGWPLGRHLTQLGAQLYRRHQHPNCKPREIGPRLWEYIQRQYLKTAKLTNPVSKMAALNRIEQLMVRGMGLGPKC
jgi:hypothetical protein